MTDFYKKSIEIILKNQHKSGSYVACPDFETYRYCWLRDGSFTAYSMDLAGRSDSSGRFFDWADRVISAQSLKVKNTLKKVHNNVPLSGSDYLPTRYTLEGNETNDTWPNFQLDGYGTWLWAICEHINITGETGLIEKYKKSIETTIDYLINLWNLPNYDCWEENGDKIHSSTLFCIYGGLKSISDFINDKELTNTIMQIKKYINDNCVDKGRLVKYVGSDEVDASLIWAAFPFKVFDAGDEIIKETVKEIQNKLLHNGGVHRYSGDTYYGGGEWLLLSCYLAWYYNETGQSDKAASIQNWVEEHTTDEGEMPEQILEHVNNEDYIDKWIKLWGKVACPLLWSHAMYIILISNKNKKL